MCVVFFLINAWFCGATIIAYKYVIWVVILYNKFFKVFRYMQYACASIKMYIEEIIIIMRDY